MREPRRTADPSASFGFPVRLGGFGEFMRLSAKKAAYVVVGESSEEGNPEFARDDKGEGRDFCQEPLDRMGRRKQQAPLRCAPAGMTISFKTR